MWGFPKFFSQSTATAAHLFHPQVVPAVVQPREHHGRHWFITRWQRVSSGPAIALISIISPSCFDYQNKCWTTYWYHVKCSVVFLCGFKSYKIYYLAAVLRILNPPLPSDCRVAEEEALVTGTQRAPAGESAAHPGPLDGGKAAGTTDRLPAKGADGGDCDGGARGRSQWWWAGRDSCEKNVRSAPCGRYCGEKGARFLLLQFPRRSRWSLHGPSQWKPGNDIHKRHLSLNYAWLIDADFKYIFFYLRKTLKSYLEQ